MPKDHGTACTCASCEAQAYTRNNYFTGKLMVERDFTDEQRYVREKLRIHHQRLHGTGIVCGLKVRAHEPPCDDRYVILEPGSAVDCCGQDILVVDEEVVDLHAFDEMQEILRTAADPDTPDDRTWDLQLCLRYAECPTEDVPVLYDECGCDDSRCAPNRILEGYCLDLLVDPEIDEHPLLVPGLDWSATVGIDGSVVTAVDAGRGRAFVLTGGTAGVVHQVDTASLAIEQSFSLGREGLALAVGGSGAELYVAAADPGGLGTADSELLVFDLDAAELGTGPDRSSGAIAGSQGSGMALRVLPDGRLLAVIEVDGAMRLWDATVTGAPDDLGDLLAGAAIVHPVVMSDGVTVIAAAGTGALHRVDLGTAGPDIDTIALAEGAADGLALVPGTGADRLMVMDAAAQVLRLVDLSGATVGVATLDHGPLDLAISPGGTFAYALAANGDDSFVQVAAIAPMRAGGAGPAGPPVPVGDRAQSIVLSDQRLWITYLGPNDDAGSGGVAVLEISETDCRGLLLREDCPDCEGNDCLVLATIRNYRPDDRILDMPEPETDPVDGTAHIDNDLGRKRLPSTQAMAEAILCILDTCCGGAEAPTAPPTAPPEPAPEPQPQPDPFELPEVTRICATSWQHLGFLEEQDFPTFAIQLEPGNEPTRLPGMIVAFDRETDFYGSIPPDLLAASANRAIAGYSSRLARLRIGLLPNAFSRIEAPDYGIWAEVPVFAMPAALALSEDDPEAGTCRIDEVIRLLQPDDDPGALGVAQNGLIVVPLANISSQGLHQLFFEQILSRGTVPFPEPGDVSYRFDLTFDGNALLDFEQRPIDAEHVAPFLPARATGDRWPGGVFESAFFYNRMPRFEDSGFQPGGGLFGPTDAFSGLNVNTATAVELARLPGVGPNLADRIVAARPLSGPDDLRTISGVGPTLLEQILPLVTFE